MSDYLGNLVARTLSQATIVHPQLPALFEPAIASAHIGSELEFEQNTFPASPSVTQPTEIATPISPSIPAQPQSALGEPEPQRNAQREHTPAAASPLSPATSQPALRETQSTLPMHDPETVASILPPNQSVVREPEPIISQASRAKGVLSPVEESAAPAAGRRPESSSVPVRVETSVEPVTPKLRKMNSRADQLESSPRGSQDNDAASSEPSTQDSQPKRPSLVRPVVPQQKIRAVEAVVPAIRNVPPFPSTPTTAPGPTINVSIGRVEIRATSPTPSPRRARPKSAKVLSLEDYLRQRANGGGR